MARGPITRSRDGSYRLRLSADERDILRSLPAQLRDLLGTDDESLFRLFPTAYTDDPKRSAEYRRLMRDELVNRRLESLAVVEATLDAEQLSEEQLTAWMKVINDLRLVLGTRLDITDDEGPETDLASDDPRSPMVALYWFLSYLLEAAVDALSGGL